MTELEQAMNADVGIERQIRNMIEAKDGQNYQRLRRELSSKLYSLQTLLQNNQPIDKTRRDEFVYALIRTASLLTIIEDYHGLRQDARLVSGSWSMTLAAIFANYQLSKDDERVVAQALEKLIESKRAQHAATQQLIEALTTVLPQGG